VFEININGLRAFVCGVYSRFDRVVSHGLRLLIESSGRGIGGVRVVGLAIRVMMKAIVVSDVSPATQLPIRRNFRNNEATAAAVADDCSGVYVETDYYVCA